MAFYPAVELETRLKTHDNEDTISSEVDHPQVEAGAPMSIDESTQYSVPEGLFESMPTHDQFKSRGTFPGTMLDQDIMADLDLGLDTNFSWEMISQGVEEPMPTQEAIDELYESRLQLLLQADRLPELRSISIKYIHHYP